MDWDPRPEFDRPRVNTILAEYREEVVSLGFGKPEDWLLVCERRWWREEVVSEEMIAHAHRVLSLLVAVAS